MVLYVTEVYSQVEHAVNLKQENSNNKFQSTWSNVKNLKYLSTVSYKGNMSFSMRSSHISISEVC